MELALPDYLKNSQELICLLDLHGNFLDFSRSWEHLLGPNYKTQLTSHSLFDYIHPSDLARVQNEFSTSNANISFEVRFKSDSQNYLWLQWSVSPFESDGGSFCIIKNINDLKKQMTLLLDSQELSGTASWEIDLSSGALFVSTSLYHLCEEDVGGFKPELMKIINYFVPESRQVLLNFFDSLSKSGMSNEIELPFLTANGRETWVRVVGRATFENGLIVRIYGTMEDVGQKRRERSEHELIVENGNFGTWDWDLTNNRVFFNDRWCKMIGLDSKEVKHDLATWDALVHPDDKDKAYQDINDHLSGKNSHYSNIHRMKHSNGKWVWILDQGKIVEYRDGKPTRFAGTHTDISYIKNLEEERSLLNDRLKLVLAAIKFGVWDWDILTNSLTWDESMFEIFGFKREDFTGDVEDWKNCLHPDDRANAIRSLQLAVENHVDFDTNFRIILPSGEIRHIAAIGFVERDSQGRGIRVSGINWDITKKMELDKTFETIVNNIPIMISYLNREGDLEWVNPHWTSLLGWNLDEVKKSDLFLNQLFDDEQNKDEVIDFINKGSDAWQDFKLINKSGESLYSSWASVKLNNGQTICFGKDLSEKRKQDELIKYQQARMISSAKLSSLGEMASGIAHEINNPLTIIKGKSHFLLKRLESKEINHDFLVSEISKIEQNCHRIVKIIKGLSTFSRQGEGDPFEVIAFKTIFEDVLELCQERFKYHGVELRTSGDLETMIKCRPTQFSQVLFNLINNANDAIVNLKDPWVNIDVTSSDSKIFIKIIDSGTGIDKAIQDKIMQPFFTTKDVGMGTGLGLSISSGIIEMHGGSLSLDEHATHTTFVIELPKP